ncbi:diaminopimelate decarboxylase [Schaalia hyovaginalis]|uniref:diaminopimelate decarboxylase n=1 Tax=Schaalia hyovaginalis TaxID=29316 RepID=UPI001F19B11A|nr:diaminopimelate decarboxylase [Schaalia hyovaginalis]MCF2710629.1 diaminopimelate decarboxylase [Schaalia hyovaginalis]
MSDAPESMDHRPLGDLLCPEPDERPDLWPWSARRREDGALEIGGAALTDLARDFATPAFILDRADLRGRAGVWATAMAEEFWDGYGMAGGDAFYAGKAFLSSEVVRTVTGEGMGVDTASLGELTMALRAGAEPSRIGLHGNNKLDSEIELALTAGDGAGIERIFIDSLAEVAQIERIASALGTTARVMVRVKTGVHAGGDEYISTGHEDQKFGVGAFDGQLDEVIAAIEASPHLELRGLHSHIGSQIQGTAAFEEAAGIVCGLAARISADIGRPLPEIDLGGGVGVAYTGDDPVPTSPVEAARAIAAVVRGRCEELGMPIPRVSVEPGRSTIAPAMVSLYRVGAVKDATLGADAAEALHGRRRYIAVDGGMSDNIRPALYGARYTATLANRISDAPPVRSRIVGKHCESGDVIVWDVDLPADTAAGDLLVVPVTGAYGYSMASNYNMLTKPGVLAVENGRAEWIMRPQTIDDLLALDPGCR